MVFQDNFATLGKVNNYSLIPEHNKSAKRRLMITLEDGRCILEPYGDIGRQECAPSGRFLTVHVKGNAPFTFIGYHLNKLMNGFQNEYIEHLYCYDKDKHNLPSPETNPPIIDQIIVGVSDEFLNDDEGDRMVN